MVAPIELSPIEPGSLDELKLERQSARLRSKLDLLRGPEDKEDVEASKAHLQQLVNFHEKGNALVSLLGYLNGDYSVENLADLSPLVYKLADPVVKDLNDKLFGMTDADEFLDIVSNQVLHLCSEDGSPKDHVQRKWARRMKEISLNFKGGMGVYRGDYDKRGADGVMSFKGRVATFNEYMRVIYIGFILEKMKLEIESGEAGEHKIQVLAETAYEYGASEEEIEEYICSLWTPKNEDAYQSKSFRMNFGAGEWPEPKSRDGKLSMKELTMGLMFAEFNANHVRFRQELSTSEQERVQSILEYRKSFEELIGYFVRLSADQSLDYRDQLFDFESGRQPMYLRSELEVAVHHGTLDADYPFIPADVRERVKLLYRAEHLLAEGGLSDVKERRTFNDSSFEDSMAYYMVDLLRAARAIQVVYSENLDKGTPDSELFDSILAQTGSFLKPDVVDAIRKNKLRKVYPGCQPWTYHVVERFYRTINVLDILKPFMAEDIDGYGAYQELLYSRVKRAKALIADEDADLEEMKALRTELVNYAKVSPKDKILHENEGELNPVDQNISMTQLGFLNTLLKEDSRTEIKEGVGVLEVDLIGFGAKNFQSLVTTAMTMLGTVNDLGAEVRNSIDTKKSVPTAGVISRAIGRSPRLKRKLWEQLLAVADRTANQDLRDVVEVLNSNPAVLSGSIDVDGGDEIRVLVDVNKLNEGSNWNDLQLIAKQFRLRVAPFLKLTSLDDLPIIRVKVEERFAELKTRETGGAPAEDNFCPVEVSMLA